MKTPAIFVSVALLMQLACAYATVREIGGQYEERVLDKKRAAFVAERFFVMRLPLEERRIGRFRAETVSAANSPVEKGDVLKRGDAIWIVVVVDQARTDSATIPVGIVWVRAENGIVIETGPRG